MFGFDNKAEKSLFSLSISFFLGTIFYADFFPIMRYVALPVGL